MSAISVTKPYSKETKDISTHATVIRVFLELPPRRKSDNSWEILAATP
jgi:hypothetical protein